MSAAYDPRIELNPGQVIMGGVFLVVFAFATVAFIIWGGAGSGGGGDATAEMQAQ